MSRAARLRRVAALEVEAVDSYAVWQAQLVLCAGGPAGVGLAWKIAAQFEAFSFAIDHTPGALPAPLEHFTKEGA